MKPLEECRACLERLLYQAAGLATGDKLLEREAIFAAQNVLDELFEHDMSPADIASIFHRKIKKITGNADPFSEFKRREIEHARALFKELEDEAAPELRRLIMFSVKGNAIDFFRSRAEVSRDFHSEINFGVDHADLFEDKLRSCSSLLFLADNAGECFFDLPLVKYITGLGVEVFYAVKGFPAQNDITAKDLEFSGLLDEFPNVISNGSDKVGLDLSVTDTGFREVFYRVDIIIAKGMGHYETMLNNTDDRLFFLMKAKCRPVALSVGAPYESYVFKNARQC